MLSTEELVEKICRRFCQADGHDPDALTDGHLAPMRGPDGVRIVYGKPFPCWQVYERKVRLALEVAAEEQGA